MQKNVDALDGGKGCGIVDVARDHHTVLSLASGEREGKVFIDIAFVEVRDAVGKIERIGCGGQEIVLERYLDLFGMPLDLGFLGRWGTHDKLLVGIFELDVLVEGDDDLLAMKIGGTLSWVGHDHHGRLAVSRSACWRARVGTSARHGPQEGSPYALNRAQWGPQWLSHLVTRPRAPLPHGFRLGQEELRSGAEVGGWGCWWVMGYKRRGALSIRGDVGARIEVKDLSVRGGNL